MVVEYGLPLWQVSASFVLSSSGAWWAAESFFCNPQPPGNEERRDGHRINHPLTRASAEWFRRPPDERYLSLGDLHAATLERSRRSRSDVIANTSLIAEGESQASGHLSLSHRDLGALHLTDWSLGQLAKIARTPARWLREIAAIPGGPFLAASALNSGLRHLTAQEDVQVLTLRSEERESRQLRALVGSDYGRIYDHHVVEMVREVNGEGRWSPNSRSSVVAVPPDLC